MGSRKLISTVVLQRMLLRAYRTNVGNITRSCRAVRISVERFYTWKKTDPEFAKAVEEIDEELIAEAEATVYKRGVEKSDTLLMFFLKHKKPEVWGGHFQYPFRGNGAHSLTITQTRIDLSGFSDEELELAEKLGLELSKPPNGKGGNNYYKEKALFSLAR